MNQNKQTDLVKDFNFPKVNRRYRRWKWRGQNVYGQWLIEEIKNAKK